jgi:hypothetical protein
MILGPAYILYGTGIMLGYHETLIHVFGLPVWTYAVMFIVAGVLKLCGLIFNWGRFSHTIGVTVATFWATTILILAPSTAGWVGACPWVAIALIAFFAAVWPDQMETVNVVPDVLNEETDPAIRALKYLGNELAQERRDNDPHDS